MFYLSVLECQEGEGGFWIEIRTPHGRCFQQTSPPRAECRDEPCSKTPPSSQLFREKQSLKEWSFRSEQENLWL